MFMGIFSSKQIKILFVLITVSLLALTILSGCDAPDGTRQVLQVLEKEERIEEDQNPDEILEGRVGAVVSAHKLATEAGAEILSAGGTAADAAIAVAAALTVVEPYFSSVLGGGTWALYYDSETDEITSLDGVGPVGSNADLEDFTARAEFAGIHYSVVPGAWDGWMLWLEEYGALDLDEILSPAIRIARDGYAVSSSMARWLDMQSQLISNRPDTARIYMPQGSLLREGDIIYQNDLADTLEALGNVYRGARDQGRSQAIEAARDYFYRGPLAEAIVDFSDNNGGYLTLKDFNDFEAEIVKPISIQYTEEIEVFQNPPNSQGITMLIALNILKGYDFSGMGPDDADSIHLQVEALKLAFADRYYHIGDPERIDIPVDELLSEEHAYRQRQRIDMQAALHWPIEDGLADESDFNNTTTFHIVDKHGNGAAVTTSLGSQFLVIGDTGIHINNRMRMVSLEEGNANQLTPGYKVRHTSCPYIVLKEGNLYILGANIGADNQPQAQVQQFINIIEFGLNAQEAIERPRFATTAFPSGTYPHGVANTLRMQQGFPSALREELISRGHNISVGGAFGSANIILIQDRGLDAQAGTDPIVDTSLGLIIK